MFWFVLMGSRESLSSLMFNFYVFLHSTPPKERTSVEACKLATKVKVLSITAQIPMSTLQNPILSLKKQTNTNNNGFSLKAKVKSWWLQVITWGVVALNLRPDSDSSTGRREVGEIEYRQLYRDCWDGEPSNRPTASEFLDRLHQLIPNWGNQAVLLFNTFLIFIQARSNVTPTWYDVPVWTESFLDPILIRLYMITVKHQVFEYDISCRFPKFG